MALAEPFAGSLFAGALLGCRQGTGPTGNLGLASSLIGISRVYPAIPSLFDVYSRV